MKELINQGTQAVLAAVQEKKTSQQELNDFFLSQAQQAKSDLGALYEVFEGVSTQPADGVSLAGMPIVLKDLILKKGALCSAGSRILENFKAPYSATSVQRLEEAGAYILARSSLDEFGMGSSNENSAWGAVKNPHDKTRVPGGSSGGSAAAVAAGASLWALGSDTGGSVRQPAAFCGVTGLKPSYGRVSRFGLMAFASSLDQIGPMALDAFGCAQILDVIAGPDERDGTSASREYAPILPQLVQDSEDKVLSTLRIGIPKPVKDFKLDSAVEDSWKLFQDQLKALGAKIIEVEMPHFAHSLPVYYLICTAEASSNLSRYNGVHLGPRLDSYADLNLERLYAVVRGQFLGAEVKRRILLGTHALSSGYYDAYYKKAAQVRRLIAQDFDQAFRDVDLVLTPTSPEVAFSMGAKTQDPLSMYASDLCTLPASLAGLPAISFPVASNSLPVGMQLMAPRFEEARLLRWVNAYQKHEQGYRPHLAQGWGA